MVRVQTLLSGLVALVIFGTAAPALATPTGESFTLDTWRGSGSVPGNDFGTVLLTQTGSNVLVKLTLASNEGFVSTGAGEALMFDLSVSSISISGLTTGFTALHTSGGTTTATSMGTGGAGSFNYAIDCSGCGNGGSDMLAGPLSFTISNITLDKFISNGTNYFASDICVGTSVSGGKLQCNGSPGATGNVSAEFDAPVGSTGVPEPMTLSLLGAGLLGAGALRRKAKSA